MAESGHTTPLNTKSAMKKTIQLVVGVSCIACLGNAQDAGVTGASAPTLTGYTGTGNVAQNRAMWEADLQRAAVEARKDKELKAAMAAQAPRQVVYRTAADFMAANRPPSLPPSERPAPTRRQEYVPEFEDTPSQAPAPMTVSSSEPEKKGLFALFSRSNRETVATVEAPSSPTYVPPYEREAPSPVVEAAEEPVYLPEPEPTNNGGFFSKLFGKKEQAPSAPPAPESAPMPEVAEAPAVESVTDAPPAPPASNGIPDAPNWNEAPAPVSAPPAPPEETASIFRRSSSPDSGQAATIRAQSEATVNGVLVTLYEGTQVSVIESSGTKSKIRLPDGRVGMISKSSLSL